MAEINFKIVSLVDTGSGRVFSTNTQHQVFKSNFRAKKTLAEQPRQLSNPSSTETLSDTTPWGQAKPRQLLPPPPEKQLEWNPITAQDTL